MNQPEARIKYEKCLKCNKEIAIRYHYDRHLSDWVCYEIPLCDECKRRPRAEGCLACKHSDELDGEYCYECVKGDRDNFEAVRGNRRMNKCKGCPYWVINRCSLTTCVKGDKETETWNGIHAQITAPKGTFDKIWNDTDDRDDI